MTINKVSKLDSVKSTLTSAIVSYVSSTYGCDDEKLMTQRCMNMLEDMRNDIDYDIEPVLEQLLVACYASACQRSDLPKFIVSRINTDAGNDNDDTDQVVAEVMAGNPEVINSILYDNDNFDNFMLEVKAYIGVCVKAVFNKYSNDNIKKIGNK